jgi:hypothetical protein
VQLLLQNSNVKLMQVCFFLMFQQPHVWAAARLR